MFTVIIGENFVSVHDTSSVKYRVYNETYTRTKTVSTGVYIQRLVKSPGKYHVNQLV